MSPAADEMAEITRRLCIAVSQTLNQYAAERPDTTLELDDIREILLKIIDYIDITDITGFPKWE